MSAPLTSLTQKPVEYNTFSFGGDDTSLGKTGFFNSIAEWDRNSSGDACKANFIFLVKKTFQFLDAIGIGTCVFGYGGFGGQLDNAMYNQTGLDRNRAAREKIVNALGGQDVCQRIPVVNLDQRDFEDYMKLGNEYFRGGQWVAQGEDPAGRKFALLRIADRAGRVFTATVHQRYRETCILRASGGGSLWTVNIAANGQLDGRFGEVNTDRAADFIQRVRTNRHEEFTVAPKP
jgi:hypothetical protein